MYKKQLDRFHTYQAPLTFVNFHNFIPSLQVVTTGFEWLPCLHPQLQKLRKDLQRQSTSLCACTGADHCTAGDGILTKSPHLWRTKGRETDRRSQNIPSILWRKCKKCLPNSCKKIQTRHGSWDVSQFHALKFNSLDFFAATGEPASFLATARPLPNDWTSHRMRWRRCIQRRCLPASSCHQFQRIWRVRVGGYV